VSIRLSLGPIDHSSSSGGYSGFAAERPAGRRYRLMVAGTNATDQLPGLPWGRNFYPHTHPIPTENPVGIPTGSPYPQKPKILHTHTHTLSFHYKRPIFILLFVTLTVGYYIDTCLN